MSLLKILALIAIAGLSYDLWQKHEAEKDLAENTSANGFVAIPMPSDVSDREVLVIAAENCPKEDSRRADELAGQLSRLDIPVSRTHSVNFTFSNPDSRVIGRVNKVMRGKLPIVFIHGKAKANPTLEEVVAEYRNTKS